MADTARSAPAAAEKVYDLVVIGGGINGAGIARDAAGRGLSVLLCEQGDLGEGTSSRSGKLVHGGLRYLEYYEFRLVREALIEREVLLRAAPHVIWPLRFVLPHSPEQRPAWLIRLGLFLYDHLGGRERLPASRALDLRHDPAGRPIRPGFVRAFEYSDCWVDDSRLVVLNALDAAARGAAVLTRTACGGARREAGLWSVALDAPDGWRTVRARALVNAAGPWVEQVIGSVAGLNGRRRVRLVKGSHLVTRKFWDGPQAYLLQNRDRRVIFVNPYLDDLALIGTTDIPYEGRPEEVAADEDETGYLLEVLDRYFAAAPGRAEVLHRFSGVRPLYDDDAENPSAVTRDYVFDSDPATPGDGRAPILSVFGGKITTYRKLAEHALRSLAPFFPSLGPPWTATAPLPGGDLPDADFEAFLAGFAQRHPWLPPRLARHYARLYGTRAEDLLDGAETLADLGRSFGPLFHEREADFLVREEWARSAEDILERRTKHGLFLDPEQRAAFADWLERAPVA
ncbi:L-erythritol 4-phosphate dehydrogenase [Tistlia consotensis]|uniref:Glycerol-3-phosphate dehydrogenase n=1 Tax=Tistlia consotensis USBA 355 TaxID=560819 RepID=A0A1Y6BP08_9PROT|nr:glycerol-3-phosphate dehydrogenase [Tistlia consotensis]SMF21953.1 L-erythritol 4-phosphate dehydrogenase [Tistlia consotensis USBA 355]SNR46422.1 L-erythritol 4-phosphate dehydrogenase [Tistlia consotensis]